MNIAAGSGRKENLMSKFKIVIPQGNGYTPESLRGRALPHLLQYGIQAEIDDDLILTYESGTGQTAERLGNAILIEHYGVKVEETDVDT